jgi:hypothetical protein
MGTRVNFTALDWGRDPASFEIRDAKSEDGGRTILELAPKLSPERRRYTLNAGAMFETTSWAYVHDLPVARSVLTIEAATQRVVREVDYGYGGESVCEVSLSDWLDVDDGQSVPLRLQLAFPGQRFTVDDRFQWRPEGLWILNEGTSTFAAQEPQRETLIELRVDQPEDDADGGLPRFKRPLRSLTPVPRAGATGTGGRH